MASGGLDLFDLVVDPHYQGVYLPLKRHDAVFRYGFVGGDACRRRGVEDDSDQLFVHGFKLFLDRPHVLSGEACVGGFGGLSPGLGRLLGLFLVHRGLTG